ncbi:hypothetical protein JCM24511_04436 [Saitozyma sp. JCM 24511]|nr:hypothetical protein JCM24511_04436 [Saitozyma sp. JCM 24511]
MHPKNPYATNKPNFAQLASRYPDFAPFVTVGSDGYASIDFQDAAALRTLTRCLLKEDWKLDVDLREDRLVPTLANRLDYLLHILDLHDYLAKSRTSAVRTDGPSSDSLGVEAPLRVLDIGTGAVAIYPLLLRCLRPSAEIVGTELDETSLTHAQSVLLSNSIPPSSIRLERPTSTDRILFPLFRPDTAPFDFTVCNPPFFASEEEMREGQDRKAESAHAAPTAAGNELITEGGEVRFVGTMIEESMQVGDRCRWYTSLIGRYSSLAPLVDLLRKHQVDNYFIKSIKQARTARWILGWSHAATRLPDTLTRPANLIPGTSFARLLPPPNTFHHSPHPPVSLDELRTRLNDVVSAIGLAADSTLAAAPAPAAASEPRDILYLAPRSNTWSRAARRQAAREHQSGGNDERIPADGVDAAIGEEAPAPLFRAQLRVSDSAEGQEAAELSMDWIEGKGKDRASVEGLWKFVLSKANLVGKRPRDAGDVGAGADHPYSRGGSGGGRGGRGGLQ